MDRPLDSELSQLILSEYPYPIAVNYQRILDTDNWEKRTRLAIEVFEYGMRAVTLGVLSQYLIRDLHEVNDPELNNRLYHKLSQPSLGDWVEFLFLSLRAYEGHRERFFMPELYDLYWDTSRSPHQPRKRVRGPYDRLVQIRNDLGHRLFPDTEEAWKKLGLETLDNLEQVLAQFGFLKNYDLIRVMGPSGEQYDYERFTGQEITTHRERLRDYDKKNKHLQAGWFYLSRHDRSLLLLHPLLIHWSNPGDIEWLTGGEFDVGVYSRLLKAAVEYIATVVRYTTEQDDPDLLAQFRNLIYYNLEKVKMAKEFRVQEPSPRTRRGTVFEEIPLVGLQQAAQKITDQQMSAVKLKYRKDLYLQRNETFRQFQDFLASDKRVFVLTGKSGVGKSNFVLSLLDEFAQSEQILPLLYDGASLTPEGSLIQFISQDLTRRLGLESNPETNLFALLHQGEVMQGKQLLLVFDAVNENANSGSLLQKIDQVVREPDYPWLKVLITSRPQAWRTMKRGLHLAEDHYYRPKDSDERWVELEEFIVKLEDFRRDELRQAYDKYQERFNLQTEYEDLKSQIRELLRDPLLLRLVAEIYRGQPIPEHIRPSEIYARYIQALTQSERLRERDLQFLEQELMPLMLYPGHYENKVAASQVNQARTSDGRPLWELVHNEDRLSSGERVNASFSRLVDAEIILLRGTPTEYELAFKYERFYEYFAGRRLGILLEDKTGIEERGQAYAGLIEVIRQHPYLWGAVQSALLNDLKNTERKFDQLIIALAQTIDQLTKDMIVSVLTTFGQENNDKASDICLSLLKLKPPTAGKVAGDELVTNFDTSQDDKLTDLVNRYLKATTASRVHMAKKAAIEVAYNLRIASVLEEAAKDKVSAVRAIVAQYIYYLWRDYDEEKAFQVLKTISDRIAGRWKIPDVKAFEVCLGVSLMMLFFHFGELERREKFLGRLQGMWKRIIGHLLFISPGEGGLTGRLKQALREGVLYFGVRIATTTVGQAEESGVILSLPEFRSFFPPSEDHKRIFKRMVPQAEALYDKECESLSEVMDVLKEVMQERDVLTIYATFVGLLGNVIGRPDESLPVVKELFEEGLKNPPPAKYPDAEAGLMMPILVWCIRNLLYGFRYTGQRLTRKDISEEVLDTYADFIWRYEERYHSWSSSNLARYRTLELGSYTYFYYLLHEEVESPLLNNMIDKAIREKDMTALIYYTVGLAGMGTHPAWRGEKPAVQSIHFLLGKLNQAGLRQQLHAPIILALANLRAYHPNIVDDLFAELREEELPQEIKRAIQARGATESLGLLLGTAGAWFARDLLVDKDPQARGLVTWILYQAIQSQNMSEWLRELLKKIVSFIYGQEVFQSRQ